MKIPKSEYEKCWIKRNGSGKQVRSQKPTRLNSDLSSSLAVLMDGLLDRSLFLSRLAV